MGDIVVALQLLLRLFRSRDCPWTIKAIPFVGRDGRVIDLVDVDAQVWI